MNIWNPGTHPGQRMRMPARSEDGVFGAMTLERYSLYLTRILQRISPAHENSPSLKHVQNDPLSLERDHLDQC